MNDEPARSCPPGVSPRFWALLLEEPLTGAAVLDVGTGSGRLALALAPHCRHVVGIDRDPDLIDEARRRAAAAGLGNVQFVVADAEGVESVAIFCHKAHIHPGLVVAHLYLSDALVEGSSKVLPPGGVLGFVGFHVDQWWETGRRSRFAYDERQVRELLARCDFGIEHLEVERDVAEFRSVDEGLHVAAPLRRKWEGDGRWKTFVEFLRAGGRTLTRSHVIVKARRS